MKKVVLGMLLCISGFASDSVLTELRQNADYEYANLDLMPVYTHGWFGGANRLNLEHFIATRKVKVVIEVGSWLGSSTICMAKALGSNGQLYAIDHWKGSVEHHDVQFRHFLPTLYEQFLSNVIHAGVDSIIVPVKKASSEAFCDLEGHILADLIYIDAGHDTEAVYKDITLYSQLLAESGVMTGDDWLWPSVRAAVEQYGQENNKTIRSEGNFWYYEPNN